MEYHVSIEARGEPGDEPVAGSAAADAFVAALAVHAGVAAFGQDRPSWAATISVDGQSPCDAVSIATAIVRLAATHAGLPDWPRVRAAAIRGDVLDEDLARPQWPDLVSGPEAAGMLGVSTSRLHTLAVSHPDFPGAVYDRPGVKLWLRAAVEQFQQGWDRRPGRRVTPYLRQGTRDQIIGCLEERAAAGHHMGNDRSRADAEAALAEVRGGATLVRAGLTEYEVTD